MPEGSDESPTSEGKPTKTRDDKTDKTEESTRASSSRPSSPPGQSSPPRPSSPLLKRAEQLFHIGRKKKKVLRKKASGRTVPVSLLKVPDPQADDSTEFDEEGSVSSEEDIGNDMT